MAKSKNEQAEVKLKLDTLRQDISKLSSRLKDLGGEKEKQYKEKNNFDKELNTLIKSAKDYKDKKSKTDGEIKKLKAEREKSNNELKSLFSKLSELKKKLGLDKQIGRRESVDDIKKQIEKIQFAIQTEALSFDREKNYMERIKKLKIKIKGIEAEESTFQELTEFKKGLKKKKDAADKIHAEIQKRANDSSELFNKLTAYSKQIADIKKQKNLLQKKLKKLKTEIDILNQKLSDLLGNWSKLSSKAPVLPDKTVAIMDKFKKKKRLTTEDILILQRKTIKT